MAPTTSPSHTQNDTAQPQPLSSSTAVTAVEPSQPRPMPSPSAILIDALRVFKYVLSASVLGLAYTLLQLPSPIHHVHSGKPLAIHPNYLVFYFLADKVFLALLATGAGAAFGVTLDLKHNLDVFEDFLEYEEITDYALTRIKLDDFFNRAYVPATFLLIAVITMGVSSVISSLAIIKKPQ